MYVIEIGGLKYNKRIKNVFLGLFFDVKFNKFNGIKLLIVEYELF